MSVLELRENALGFEIWDGEQLVCLYRAREELPRLESPKPCFAPIYTPSGGLITEYRPADHAWHTGLYFGWVHVNEANLWGGPWYLPEKEKYEYVEHSHGVQRHDDFVRLEQDERGVVVEEALSWLDADDAVMVRETRVYTFAKMASRAGYWWTVETDIVPAVEKVVLGASRAARYSGFELRMGPPFAEAYHRSSEGLEEHENIMGQRGRWVSAAGAKGGMVAMLDHPQNVRHPVTWFARKNLLGAGLLMGGDLEVERGGSLKLRYGVGVFDEVVGEGVIEELYQEYVGG